MTKMDELVAMVKKAEAKAKEEKCCKAIKTVLTVIGIVVVVAAIAYAVYKLVASLKKDEESFDDVDVCDDEDSCIELEFTFPEEEEAEEDTITIVAADEADEEIDDAEAPVEEEAPAEA